MLPKSLKLGILTLAAALTLAFAGCATAPKESDASFVSNPPPLESYQSAVAAAPAGYNALVAYPGGRPSAGSNCQSGGFS